MPLPVIIILLSLAVYFSLKHKHSKSVVCVTVSLLGLVLVSFPHLPNALLKPLERQTPQFDMSQPVEFIVVLGCRHINDPAVPITSQVSPCSLIRAVEALRIFQFNPNAKIVTSGNVGKEAFSNAYMTRQLLLSLGVPEEQVIQVELSKDTAEEAQNLRPTLSNKPFALVTSATHMQRAKHLFEQQNLAAIPAPTEHLARESGRSGLADFVPDGKNIYHFERWWYEWMSSSWVWIQEWFN